MSETTKKPKRGPGRPPKWLEDLKREIEAIPDLPPMAHHGEVTKCLRNLLAALKRVAR